MRSNPGCPLCNHKCRGQIDPLMYNGATPAQVKSILTHQLNRARNEYDQWMIGYNQKRLDETLKDTDIAEKNARLETLMEKEELEALTLNDLLIHEKHATFRPNQSFRSSSLEDNDILEHVNFSQVKPHTLIGEAAANLTFKNCNLLNCDVPKDATVERCLTMQKSFCSHLHPDMDLDYTCKEVCSHISTHIPRLFIEGVLVAENVIEYEDKVVK